MNGNITLKGLKEADNKLKDKIWHYLKYGIFKPIDHLKIGGIDTHSFGFVKDIQYLYQTGISLNGLSKFLQDNDIITIVDFESKPLLHVKEIQEYFKQEVIKINKVESDLLGSIPSIEEVNANVDRFGKYHSYPQLRKLICKDVTKIEEVRKMKYITCLVELAFDKDASEYEKDLNRILTK